MRGRSSLNHSQELLQFVRLWPAEHCIGRAGFVDLALMHEDYAVAHLAREAHFVRHHQLPSR
ncbi:protein of unknown function [Cupriavidus taiwanensis]|nr:protein of unknown function [Cupriavidus taiwanensis]